MLQQNSYRTQVLDHLRSDAEDADVTPNQELEVLVQIDAETAADHGINTKLRSGDIRTDGRDKVPKV